MQTYCLLGDPIAHSLSPAMMNLSFQALGMDCRYDLRVTNERSIEDRGRELREEGIAGWNCTMPCKHAMVPLCDKLSTAARIGGAVNTVKNEDGVLTGHTTDGTGFMNAMASASLPLPGKKMTLLGTGGAASSILIQAALDGVSEIAVFANRPSSRNHAEDIASKLAPHSATRITLHSYTDPEELREEIRTSAVLVNATPVGMDGGKGSGRCLIPDASFLRPDLFVYDIIYHPKETPLLALAASAGCRTSNGESMLLMQGAAAFRIWTGRDMPVDLIREKVF